MNWGDTTYEGNNSPTAICDAGFTSRVASSSFNLSLNTHMGCALKETKSIVQVFVQGMGGYWDNDWGRNNRNRFGAVYIHVGTSSTLIDGIHSPTTDAYKSQIYDTGFYLLPNPATGDIISLQADNRCYGTDIVAENRERRVYDEIRAYQTPNLF